jgi:aminoglycoside phosphotransferase (APT) family kinase protein
VAFLPGGTGSTTGSSVGFEHSLDYARSHYEWSIEGVEHPVVDRLWEWLDDNLPPAPPEGVSWGDSRIGNMMFDDGYRALVVMDWEQASLGGPMLDLGWWLFRDVVDSELFPRLDGLGTREETIDLWEEGTGLKAEHLLWYEVFAGIRHATLVIRTTNMFGQGRKVEVDDNNSFTRVVYSALGWGTPR